MSLPTPAGDSRPVIRRGDTEVHNVTFAKTPLSEEQKARTKRYLISMSIRVACFLGVMVTEGWVRWAMLVGAVALPYIAVVMANAGRESDVDEGPADIAPQQFTAIEGPRPGIGT